MGTARPLQQQATPLKVRKAVHVMLHKMYVMSLAAPCCQHILCRGRGRAAALSRFRELYSDYTCRFVRAVAIRRFAWYANGEG